MTHGTSSGGVNACYIDSNDDGAIHGLALGGDTTDGVVDLTVTVSAMFMMLGYP